ncbi:ran-binding proteins 9/10 homolog isoform X2 [Teleopsis dalmanni]|uniref:ran-binding proteins 9/10 homolog isoform X2 n=1 Tax=Teleopsis dalmanni TaxID=139649 RepID=UPI0018CE4BC9|nr:ran-binding proteins 9/10 homolog isoform X2 [Teleopsis dalmanni]XP_037952070.1 ran-binding proteins 9/10 homolog isoform X2 [Teleopsis dalmanni]
MDAENDNEQPNSSSASSSNNSSSSNLLVNLPLLPILHSQDDEDVVEHLPFHPPSPPNTANNQQLEFITTGQPQHSDNSAFISPLLFNNNTTPPPSSSSSSSSSSSHILHLFHHQHSEHPHQQHFPPPSHQQHAPSSSQGSEQENIIDDNAIADTIDASTIDNIDELQQLNAEPSSSTTSRQPPQPLVGTTSAGIDTAVVTHESHTPPTTLPLLLQQDNKQTSSSYFSRPYYHSNQHNRHQHTRFGTSGTFAFDSNKTNDRIMFTNNDSSVPMSGTTGNSHQHQSVDRLKMLYPNVDENETPLPRCWSQHDKCLSIGLSENNLRVHYKGVGKQHNDAASVRTAYPIPPACGLYYFEVKIISKGKNGYMGIGLTAQQFRMNRLPGWDKQSYGYHGDDGNSFSSSGSGQSYGPTFTTGDVIGCCVNFVNNTCFYTKNGIDLGIAFRDLPVNTKLYPTVGLQTPGEEVDANFGQEPFKFDQIEDMMKQMREEMKSSIYNFPMPIEQGDPTTLLHKMVSSYLVHNGYSQTAEAFSKITGQNFQEDMASIRNRQKILKLVMSGKMGQAIDQTIRSYPGLLENNKNLWFMLKCRQFIEMINGSDIEYCPTNKQTYSTTTQTTPPNQTSVIQSTKAYQNGKSAQNATINSAVINEDNQQDLKKSLLISENVPAAEENVSNNSNIDVVPGIDFLNDVEMENNGHTTNGNSCKNGNINDSLDIEEDMDVDMITPRKHSYGIERILEFGKELSQMGQQLEKENKMNDDDRQMLEDAFSLIAYSNPWASPLGWQLCPTKRENVCTALNSAILESMSYARRPPLDVCLAHASELLKVMAQASLGACAFVNIEDIFPQN